MGIWEAIAARGTAVRFGPGDVLLHHGDTSGHCYAIREGQVLVTATSSQGATVVLGRREAGAVVGEMAALDGLPRSATVRARTEVDAVVLTPEQFAGLIQEQPELALEQIRRLSRQLRDLTERFSVRGEELRMRVLQLLETNADTLGDPVFRSTREELAGWVGATREAVIRTLKQLEEEGVVVMRRGAVELVV